MAKKSQVPPEVLSTIKGIVDSRYGSSGKIVVGQDISEYLPSDILTHLSELPPTDPLYNLTNNCHCCSCCDLAKAYAAMVGETFNQEAWNSAALPEPEPLVPMGTKGIDAPAPKSVKK